MTRRRESCYSPRSNTSSEGSDPVSAFSSDYFSPKGDVYGKIVSSSVGKAKQVSTLMSLDDVRTFERFDPSLNPRRFPVVVFTGDVEQQLVWYKGRCEAGVVLWPSSPPDVVADSPVVMSPAYLGFVIEPYEMRYLHFRGVGMLFQRPQGGQFMQPSIDTVLVCLGISELFRLEATLSVRRVIDVGSGSGFIGKYLAMHALGKDPLSVTLVDIDATAIDFAKSPGFCAPDRGHLGRAVMWRYSVGDACELLRADATYDLVVSNPPYVPTELETKSDEVFHTKSSFWEGTGLLVFLLRMVFNGTCPRLILALTSLTFKSKTVRRLFESAATVGVAIRVLVEREVAWKAWYAGSYRVQHLLANSSDERTERQTIGCCQFFVGATEHARLLRPEIAHRARNAGYNWHVAYVLEVKNTKLVQENS